MITLAVVCRRKAFEETRLKLGWWSYGVRGLDWFFVAVEDGQPLSRSALARQGAQAIVWEDWSYPQWAHDANIPLFAVIVDSNTSKRRRANYLKRAGEADALLIDQDGLDRFMDTGKPAHRWQYAVNERVFCPRQKLVDVAYHVERTPARAALAEELRTWARGTALTYTDGGGRAIAQYAQLIGQARVVIHKATHPQCRSHRFFDALASGACLLSDVRASVPEDGFEAGKHYLLYGDTKDLIEKTEHLLASGEWLRYAERGREYVLAHHTWAHRAAEFADILQGYGLE